MNTLSLPLLTFALLQAGCISTIPLSQHPLDDRSVALLAEIPDAPFVDFDMTIFDRVGNEPPTALDQRRSSLEGMVLGEIGKADHYVGPRNSARTMIDSVLYEWSMADQIVDFVREKGAQSLRYRLTEESEADYILALTIDDYGIGSDKMDSPLYFEIMGRLQMRDALSGKRIWEGEVYDLVPVARALSSVGLPDEDASTPLKLEEKSYEEMQVILRSLAGFAAGSIIGPLREAYRQVGG